MDTEKYIICIKVEEKRMGIIIVINIIIIFFPRRMMMILYIIIQYKGTKIYKGVSVTQILINLNLFNVGHV